MKLNTEEILLIINIVFCVIALPISAVISWWIKFLYDNPKIKKISLFTIAHHKKVKELNNDFAILFVTAQYFFDSFKNNTDEIVLQGKKQNWNKPSTWTTYKDKRFNVNNCDVFDLESVKHKFNNIKDFDKNLPIVIVEKCKTSDDFYFCYLHRDAKIPKRLLKKASVNIRTYDLVTIEKSKLVKTTK